MVWFRPMDKATNFASGTETILVAVMMCAVPGSALKPEFDTFLFASIGEDSNGMTVSVLSGLAQSDLDPWQEAAKLAQMPGKTAVERLASLIKALPGRAWAYSEARAIATRLIALLPHADDAVSSQTPQGLGAMMNSRPWWIYVLLMSFVLGSQFIVASRQLPPAAHRADVNPTGDVAPPQPPVSSGQ
jgi:hypothetical protein